MNSFQHSSPELRLFYGADSLRQLARELDRIDARRAVVFCGQSLVRHGQGLGLVREALGERCAGVFDGVRAHSPLPSVQEGADLLARLQADAVVAVGGGSAIVTARAASILLAEAQPAQALSSQLGADGKMISPKLLAPKLAQFIVPTTPTTAYAKAGSAVLEEGTGRRLALFDPKTRARAIFIHPLLAQSAPNDLIHSASLNAFAMAVEGLESAIGDPLADASLMHALALIGEHLPGLEAAPQDAELRGQLMLAALLCGQGTDYTGGGVAFVLGHVLGSRFDLGNGIANAIMLPHTMRFNAQATGQRLGKVHRALGIQPAAGADPSETAIGAVEALLARLPIPRRLRDVGVPREAFAQLAALAVDDWFLNKNPRPIEGPGTLVEILEAAW